MAHSDLGIWLHGGTPHPAPPERPNPEPDRGTEPAPGDEGSAPPADEKDQREKRPGRARMEMGRVASVRAVASAPRRAGAEVRNVKAVA